MAKILSVYNRLQAGDYENGIGGKRRVSWLTQFIHATLHVSAITYNNCEASMVFSRNCHSTVSVYCRAQLPVI